MGGEQAPGRRAVRLAHVRSPELVGGALLVVPIGSIEQHGPHLPLSTDLVVAEHAAERAADELAAGSDAPEGGVVLAPAVPYGSSGEHQGFPGTASIGREALRMVVIELVRSVSDWAAWTVFVNGHGGNAPTLAEALTQLRDEGHDVAWAPCSPPGSDAHAGRAETSMMLALHSDRVALDLAEPGPTAPIEELLPRLQEEGVRAVSPNGVLGDPTGASAEEGAALLDAVVADVVARISDWQLGRNAVLERLSP